MITMGRVRKTGFTIVEMVVVITVIAVLMTLTIFSFGSWRERTAKAEVTTSLTDLATVLKNELNFKNVYPSTLPSNYTAAKGVTVTYSSRSSGTAYCASAVSKSVSSVQLYITNTNPKPSTTSC